jgi:putative peptide maturation dehydrogenase
MLIRRCTHLTLAPRESLHFDLSLIAAGGSGLRSTLQWFALAPPRDAQIALTDEEVMLLGRLSPTQWSDFDELARASAPATLRNLLANGLIVAQGSDAAERDEQLRNTHWRNESAALHYMSRWRCVDTDAIQKELAETDGGDLLSRLGPPEPVVHEWRAADKRVALHRPEHSPLEELFRRRVTCRNFDRTCALTLEQFSTVLYRAWGARAVHDFGPNVPLLKKGVPSAGGLHATEAYLLIQRVDAIAPGLYHYHPIDHALEALRELAPADAAALARRFVAGQDYFVDAHVMVIAASRFRRTFWKYRDHAKAYRALLLDIGHLSQAQYLAATELGLGAFITAAINEVDIEQAFGLEPLEEGPLAVTGFGIRAAQRREVEWDPLNAVWPTS